MSIENSSELTKELKDCARLGSRMAAKGFSLEDDPYYPVNLWRESEAWQRGFSWWHVLQSYTKPKLHEVA